MSSYGSHTLPFRPFFQAPPISEESVPMRNDNSACDKLANSRGSIPFSFAFSYTRKVIRIAVQALNDSQFICYTLYYM
jgi:hypothetical protein